MTDQELKNLVASLAVSQAKTDAQLAKTDEKLSKMADLYGGLSGNIGHAVEDFFYNSLRPSRLVNGIHYDFINKNITRSNDDCEREFDILLTNGSDVAIVEVKHRANFENIDKLLNKLGPDFVTLFPEFSGYRVHLVLATFSIADEVRDLALHSKITILQRKGDVIETIAG